VNKGNDGKWHMHVAAFVQHCGFNQWASNSQIVHAVADSPDGQYRVQAVAQPVWAHNPAVARAPSGEWVMTWCANTSARRWFATCANGSVVANSSTEQYIVERNFMAVAANPEGPWSTPEAIDQPFDEVVPPFETKGLPNRNTNLVMSIGTDGSMVGLWRRCCSPSAKYRPPGGGGASVIFAVHGTNWRNISTWKANSTALFPELKANGYEDPHIWRDAKRNNVYHAIFHNMIGGWHQPEFPNIQVGAHAYSADGGRSWVDTGIAFNLTVEYADGTSTTFIQRERPHVVLDESGEPSHLVSGVTYSLLPTLPTCTIVQPIGAR
jgi:hypothetical protein